MPSVTNQVSSLQDVVLFDPRNIAGSVQIPRFLRSRICIGLFSSSLSPRRVLTGTGWPWLAIYATHSPHIGSIQNLVSEIPSFDPNDIQAGLQILENVTSNAEQIQENFLEEILIKNVNTEYLQRFLNGRSDKQSFNKRVPLVGYDDMKPYIERIANGEPSGIISAQPIIEFGISSGTTGRTPKMMPITAGDLRRRKLCRELQIPTLNEHIKGLDEGKGMIFQFVRPEIVTFSGLLARPGTTRYLKSNDFNNRSTNWYDVYTSPDEIFLCEDNKQSMYCQMLCGLAQKEYVVRIGAHFAASFLRAVKFLEDHWKDLCSNIRTGHVSDWITDKTCRTLASTILGDPNPELADKILRECGGGSWEGIIRKLWPKAKYIETIVTGSMAQYIPMLEFYGSGLPLVSTVYASAESWYGINVEPLCKPRDVSYTFIPLIAYFEFLPLEDEETGQESCGRQEDTLVDLVDVKLGALYELVVTTVSGLYRFRVGDILQVTGFYNNTPQFRFVRRQNVVLSIDLDKTTEDELLKAVTSATPQLEQLGVMLWDYTSHADTSSIPGHYVLFWELREGESNCFATLDPQIMEDCCFAVEKSLNFFYRQYRQEGCKAIGPLEIRVVEHGTFDRLIDFFISRGSSMNQYKTPRCIQSEEALRVLDSRVVEKFFSQKSPSWDPYET